jgi:SAM-dependent methyltransferase
MPMRPAGGRYGYFRGSSIVRVYIEEFLEANRHRITGRCLEVGDASYTDRYGHDVQRADILDVHPENERATVLGDLQDLSRVKDASYECIIVTQVMQYLSDPAAGVREMHRILSVGGSVLVTVPTMAPTDPNPGDIDLWRFMPAGTERIFASCFQDFEVLGRGNLLTGLGYWAGLAREDLPRRAWRSDDPIYPVIITVRATRT